jgi:uncharacterized protein YpmB
MNRNSILLLIILAVAIGAYFLFMNEDTPTSAPEEAATEMESGDYVGMTTTEAEVYAVENTVDFRTGTIDGEALPVTMDFRPGRITAEVKNDVVVGYTVE